MNKNVLVTGGTRGIGEAISREFAKKGYNIIINYVKSNEKAKKLKEELEAKYNIKVLPIKADLSNETEINNMVDMAIKEFGKIDVLVNNAGIVIDKEFEDRTVEDWEGLMAAQECLPTNEERDKFGAHYRVLSRAWEALSPDAYLIPFSYDYIWLSKVYESIKPTNNSGAFIWARLGKKTMDLVHQNIVVDKLHEDLEILCLDANIIDDFIKRKEGSDKKVKKIEIALIAKIRKHSNDPRFVRLGERLEELRERHEQGLITSIEFLKMLLDMAKEAVEAEREVVPEEEIDKGKAALTELFNGVKNQNTPIIVERVVNDIDDIVRSVRYDDWQKSDTGEKEIKKALRKIVWVRYQIKDEELFNKAYKYVKEYY